MGWVSALVSVLSIDLDIVPDDHDHDRDRDRDRHDSHLHLHLVLGDNVDGYLVHAHDLGLVDNHPGVLLEMENAVLVEKEVHHDSLAPKAWFDQLRPLLPPMLVQVLSSIIADNLNKSSITY